ncbi:MAG: sigma-70 family RNA polymerase sigma factor [bacterium]
MYFERTDEEIINSYKEGNVDDFHFLIKRYTPPLFNFSMRFVGKDNATDITQEVFIKVWKKIDNFDFKKSSFKTWIFTIAKNTALDFLRKNKKTTTFTELEPIDKKDSFSDKIEDENILPDEALQKIQDKEFLNDLLENLSLEHKTVLTLHYQEEMTFDEIGKILNKPLNTVKSYHHRAILKLRKML